MKYSNVHGFTLIEILIVILIIGIISFATYIPYAHHQKKTLVNQSVKELSQLINKTRNTAIHGIVSSDAKNTHTYIELTPWESEVITYSLEHDRDMYADIDLRQEEERISLPKGVFIHSVNGTSSSIILWYESITWSIPASFWLPEDIIVTLSYKNTDSPSLQKDIKYYTLSHISDY